MLPPGSVIKDLFDSIGLIHDVHVRILDDLSGLSSESWPGWYTKLALLAAIMVQCEASLEVYHPCFLAMSSFGWEEQGQKLSVSAQITTCHAAKGAALLRPYSRFAKYSVLTSVSTCACHSQERSANL